MDSPIDTSVPPLLHESLISASAGFGIRFLSRLVDLIYGVALGLATGFVGGIIFLLLSAAGKISPHWLETLQQPSFHTYGLAILGTFLYYTLSEGLGGKTLGKLICGLSVVQTDGRPCSMLSAFKRDLAYHWDALFFGLVGYSSMKKNLLEQRYGDVWAKTVVVKKDKYTPTPAHPAWRIFAGILGGSLVWMVCQFIAMLIKVL